MVDSFLYERQWERVDVLRNEPKEKQIFSIDDLSVSKQTLIFLKSTVPGLYLHQKEAIKASSEGRNVCMITGTASGKSLPFYAAGIETVSKNPNAKIIAIYPLKALGREQERRWESAFKTAGVRAKVGRIDGDVKTPQLRKTILRECQVVAMTPDIIHSWLLSNVGDRDVLKFLQNVALFIVDEVHTYTGVFGSNSAFLFRRLRHLMALEGKEPQFICASATMASAEKHLGHLFGVSFYIIGPELDTSPKYEVNLYFLKPPTLGDYLTEITHFLKHLSSSSNRFLAFIDSRKQTELITSILSRGQQGREQDDIDIELNESFDSDHLNSLNILPYRSGYEEQDQLIIQDRLSKGSLRGVVSTSALELGLDIAELDSVVLLGVPYSATSLLQRIGRVGRNCPGSVYVIHSGTVFDEMVFKEPKKLLNRPLTEGALYLQNPRIQYIHALCLSREGGEHDQFCSSLKIPTDENDFVSPITWPDGFVSLCKSERTGEITSDLQAMKSEANDNPNYVYPLRDVESQFKVQFKQGPVLKEMGSLSYSQVLREAYPGAVYYYATESFRVQKIMQRSRIVYVRSEKKYTTNPATFPPQVFPNLMEGNIYNSKKYGNILVIESNCQVREAVVGFKEKRGSSEQSPFKYPLTGAGINVFFDLPRFTRNYFTSGVVFSHPCFDVKSDILEVVARLIYESFLMSIPFERQDIDVSIGKMRVDRPPYVEEGSNFIVIYDRTYGSLRLSGYVLGGNLLNLVLQQAVEIANIKDEVVGVNGTLPITTEVIEILELLKSESSHTPKKVDIDSTFDTIPDDQKYERIILPGGMGLAIRNNNAEYKIDSIFFHPKQGVLCYRGKYLNQDGNDSLNIIWPVIDVCEIPGESLIGYYDYETGEIMSASQVQNYVKIINE